MITQQWRLSFQICRFVNLGFSRSWSPIVAWSWISIQLDYSDVAFTLTLIQAGPMPAAESAHNKTLQFSAICIFSCPKKIVYTAGFKPISAIKGMFVLEL